MYNLLYTIFKVNVYDIKPNIKNQPKKLFHDVYGRMQKKCLSCVVCSNSIHKCSYESVQYQKKNQNRPFSYMVLYVRFWAKKFLAFGKKRR